MCCCSAQPRADGHPAEVAAPLCPGSPLAFSFFFLSPYLFWFVFAWVLGGRSGPGCVFLVCECVHGSHHAPAPLLAAFPPSTSLDLLF